MLLRDRVWAKIKSEFSQEERIALVVSITGNIMCPAGVMLAEDKIPTELRNKLEKLMTEVQLGTKFRDF